jgi:hypothetical protein
MIEFDPTTVPDPPLLSDLARNSYMSHGTALALTYLEELSQPGLFHVRSNLLEIARAAYRKIRPREDAVTAERAATLHATSMSVPVTEAIRSEVAEFMELTSFESFPSFDPYHLLYWEHRMGTWHANVLLESDIAHETTVLFNTREILSMFLSVPLEDRLQANGQKALIEQTWPVLAFSPFNRTREVAAADRSEFDRDLLDVRRGRVTATAADDDELSASIEWRSEREVAFWITKSDPQRGDSVAYELEIDCEPTASYCLSLDVISPYEAPSNRGFMTYAVTLGPEVLFEEDVAVSSQSWHLRAWWTADTSPTTLRIEIHVR